MRTNLLSRLGSMLLDHLVMSIVAMLFFIPLAFESAMAAIEAGDPTGATINFESPLIYIAIIGYAVYLCKDSFDGRSVGKRSFRLQVVDEKSGQPASVLQCVTRNVFILVWPAEVIILLFDPERRLGDRIAGTRVVAFTPESPQRRGIDVKQLIVAFFLAYIFFLFIFNMAFATPLWRSW